jgi:hypothetical protein
MKDNISTFDKTSTFEYDLDGQLVTVTVARATTRMAVRRYRMMVDGEKLDKESPDPDLGPIRNFVFPDVASVTVSVTGISWPMTADEFADLPDAFTRVWRDKAYGQNPQWRESQDKEGDEKKESTS